MRGLIGGVLTGGLVSVVGLGVASVVTELPPGLTPPDAPLVDAPMVDEIADPAVTATATQDTSADAPSSPVGSVTIVEPLAPELPEGEAVTNDVTPEIVDGSGTPDPIVPEVDTPRADTDPLDEPQVVSIEGSLQAPVTADTNITMAEPDDPVFPNPQSLAPATPATEADLTVSTSPAQPIVVVEPEPEIATNEAEDAGEDDTEQPTAPQAQVSSQAQDADDSFVLDLGAGATVEEAPTDVPTDDILASATPDGTPRFQLQGGENALLGDRDTGVTVRRPSSETSTATAQVNALADFAAPAPDVANTPLMSIVLIDDGSMSAAAAALSGLPFPVTIALDPSLTNVASLMDKYRSDGFEVAVIAKLPEGALPSDVEITFESVFATLPDAIAVLDIGEGGMQTDRAVTEQAMDILAEQGRGFVTTSKGLNMAGRAAEAANVPAAVVYRDLDEDDQDARIVRRFVDQAAFRARQESGVVLVGRVRPDTISALILWGTANNDGQVAVVPLSTVLLAQ